MTPLMSRTPRSNCRLCLSVQQTEEPDVDLEVTQVGQLMGGVAKQFPMRVLKSHHKTGNKGAIYRIAAPHNYLDTHCLPPHKVVTGSSEITRNVTFCVFRSQFGVC